MWAIGALIAVLIRFPIQFGALIVAISAGFAALSYEVGRRSDRAQASSRVGEVIRERVPASRPILDRISEVSADPRKFLKGAKSETSPPPPPPSSQPVGDGAVSTAHLDPTVVSALPVIDPDKTVPEIQTGRADDVDKVPSAPIDQTEWASPSSPEVSGDGVWVAPENPKTGGPGEDGQYRLWD